MTFVKLRGTGDGLAPLVPSTPMERRRYDAAEKRQAARLERVRRLREALAAEATW